MSYYIEVVCSKQSPTEGNTCYSQTKSNPSLTVNDGNASLRTASGYLRTLAKKTGWVITSDGFVCPNCKGSK